ncbi:MAG: hypothetical protein LBR22_02465 [Desulfovibrio sp.]|jgi:hypothetical protein|nr:hypothetical protein [Desulfovibrio sp.]
MLRVSANSDPSRLEAMLERANAQEDLKMRRSENVGMSSWCERQTGEEVLIAPPDAAPMGT